MPPTPRDEKLMASLPGFQGVLDPADRLGAKNRLIDEIHRSALEQILGAPGRPRYASVVDFGCGVGRLSSYLLRFGDRVLGFDPEIDMVAQARSRNLDEHLSFYTELSDLPKLPSPVLVVSAYVLAGIPAPLLVASLATLATQAGADAAFVAIERMTRSPEADPGDIESRSVEWYASRLRDAGWGLEGHRFIRRSDSRVQRLNVRGGRILRRPLPHTLVRRLAELEATGAPKPTSSGYTDAILWGSALGMVSRNGTAPS